MAGSIAVTKRVNLSDNGGRVDAKEITIGWTGDASDGSVPTLAVTGYPGWWITKVVTNPGAVAPTAAYDITGIGPDGEDLFDGGLLNRSASDTEVETFASQIPSAGFILTLANNSVVSAVGTIKLFLNR